ncbi:hypothetical protein CTAYLR_005619 [Chrysophaeum taylorii]|uniref:Inositol polyphosphate-related phosphatase domain-containing protein n=1 Tax=Chrysophaeum taylorii TaxID=2483200 RepID=A0AAD7U8R9_9STRA|nr:hypothetical protein CTAYLR_005619 [Chrysophaeum taylorii]
MPVAQELPLGVGVGRVERGRRLGEARAQLNGSLRVKWAGKLEGWLSKTRKNAQSSSLFTTRRYFVLNGASGMVSWYESPQGRLLGEESARRATIEHPSERVISVSFASGRRDALRVDENGLPSAKEWVVAFRTVARASDLVPGVSRRVFTVHKLRGKRAKSERRVEVTREGVLRTLDLEGRVRREVALSRLARVERSRFVPSQLVLRWQDRKTFTLEFRTIGEAETFYRLLLGRSDESRSPRVGLKRRPEWLRIRVCSWNVGNKMPASDLAAWLCRGGHEVSDRDLDAIAREDVIDALIDDLEEEEGEEEEEEEEEVESSSSLELPSTLFDDNTSNSNNNNKLEDVVVVGAQECAYRCTDRARNDREDWVRVVSAPFLSRGYKVHCEEHFWGLRLLVFVLREHSTFTSTVDASRRGCGIGDRLGNKGAIGAALSIYDTTFCFVNAHLEASQTEVQKRNEDFSQIVDSLALGRSELDILNQFDHVFFFGDLNYRVDVPEALFFESPLASSLASSPATATTTPHDVAADIERREVLRTLREADQLDAERQAGRAFWGFEEAPVFDFAPTYRFQKRPDPTRRRPYTPNRTPSWTDRVLWKSLPGAPRLVQTLLTSVDGVPALDTSDHAPLVACFAVRRTHVNDDDDDDQQPYDDVCGHLVFDEVSANAGPGLAPFHFRKPQHCVLRVFGRLVNSTQTDYARSAACLAPRWKAEDVPPVAVARTATFATLRKSVLSIQLFSDVVLGTALLPLADACDARGRPAPFTVFLAHRGVTSGNLKGVLRARGPLFRDLPIKIKPPLPLALQAAASLTDDEAKQTNLLWRKSKDDRSRSKQLERRWTDDGPDPGRIEKKGPSRRGSLVLTMTTLEPLRALSNPLAPDEPPDSPPPAPERLRGSVYSPRPVRPTHPPPPPPNSGIDNHNH